MRSLICSRRLRPLIHGERSKVRRIDEITSKATETKVSDDQRNEQEEENGEVTSMVT